MTRALKLLAPSIAVLVFWWGFESAWMALLAYHAQIVWWSRRRWRVVWAERAQRAAVVLSLVTVLAGPLLFLLLPYLAAADLQAWLATYGLQGPALMAMIPYFGIVHPVLEQMHWHDLRNETWLAHACFAVYHALVLWKLMTPLGLVLVLGVLLATSVLWYRLARRFQGAFVPCCTHLAADLGIIVAAWWSIR
jgi:hypothetical protein